LYETNHDTMTEAYKEMKAEETPPLSNPCSTIYVLANTLIRRAEIDHNEKLNEFCVSLLENLHLIVERDGKLTRDLA